MKRSCKGCRAIQCARPYANRCELGYEIEAVRLGSFLITFRPKEECPKPRTWKEMYIAENGELNRSSITLHNYDLKDNEEE